VLVRGDREPGQYRLLNSPFNPAQGMMGPGTMGGGMGPGMMGGSTNPMGGRPNRGNAEVVATLSYNGTVDPLPLPDQLIPVETLPEPQTVRQFTLNHGMGMGMGMGMVFLINGKAFEHDRIDTQVALNTVEDWDIVNTGTMTHPFHLHINDFQVVSRNGQEVPFRAWKDVVPVSPGETVRIRIPFRDYAGKTVYHCHVLDHEDRGMMGMLEMQPA
jgi:FtsP/CotA-like multicopper oxidase with cupredoxin domain